MLYRNRVLWLFANLLYLFVFLLTAGLALNASAPGAGRVAGAIIALAIGVWLVWSYHWGILCDDRGVTVRQWRGRSLRVPWSEVDGFRIDRPMSVFGSGESISVVLKDGRVLRSQSACGLAAGSRWTQRVVDQLQARHQLSDHGQSPVERA